MTKTCSTCETIKPFTEFAAYGPSKDGFRGQCRGCRAAYVKEWRANNVDAVRAASRKYARKNKVQRGAYIRAFRTGFTDEHFRMKMAEQNGTCAICSVPLNTLPAKAVHADHDHKTKKTRGILCRHCNRGLGGFSDSPEVLERAAAYLRRYAQTDAEDNPK